MARGMAGGDGRVLNGCGAQQRQPQVRPFRQDWLDGFVVKSWIEQRHMREPLQCPMYFGEVTTKKPIMSDDSSFSVYPSNARAGTRPKRN